MHVPIRIALILSPLVVLAAVLATPAQQQQSFVYTNNGPIGPNTVSAFSVGPGGALTQIAGSPFLTGGNGGGGGAPEVDRLAVVGNRLYVANEGTFDISGFAINGTSGALTSLPGSPYAFGTTSSSAEFSLVPTPDGRFLYVMDAIQRKVVTFVISSDGSLSIAGAIGPLANEPRTGSVSPDGRYLSVPFFEHEVAMYEIGVSGILTEVVGSPFPAGSGMLNYPTESEFDCTTRYLYSGAASVSNYLYGFRVEPAGALTMLPGFPLDLDDAEGSSGILVSSDGRFLFVANGRSNEISVFAIAVDGSLNAVAGSPFALPFDVVVPEGLSTDAAGRYLYVTTSFPVGVAAYQVGLGGSLTLVPGSPFLTGVPANNHPDVAVFPAKTCGVAIGATTCLVDDSTGDTFTEVTDQSSPLYGTWNYTVASSGMTISGVANVVRYAAGRSLTSYDSDYSAENRQYYMNVVVNYGAGTGVVKIQRRGSSIRYVLRDRNIEDNQTCP